MDRLRQALLRRFVPLAALLALAGCGRDIPLTIYVEDSFSPEELGMIRAAIDDWNALSRRRLARPGPVLIYGGRVHDPVFKVSDLDDGRSVMYRFAAETPDTTFIEKDVGGGISGYGCDGDILILPFQLCPECDDHLRYLRITATHELGHFLGFPHVFSEPCIMTPGNWDNDHLTANDEKMFCLVYDCN